MKTAHQLARELLALPDHPVFHFDPSLSGMDEENDTSLTEPTVEVNEPGEEEEQPAGHALHPFITISGEHDLEESEDIATRALGLLVAGGHVTREKVNEAKEIARNTP